jgi:hypothetical protein
MRKNYSIRLSVPEHIGSELHRLALKESRSDSAMINLLVGEALTARRSAASQIEQVSRLTQLLRSPSDAA